MTERRTARWRSSCMAGLRLRSVAASVSRMWTSQGTRSHDPRRKGREDRVTMLPAIVRQNSLATSTRPSSTRETGPGVGRASLCAAARRALKRPASFASGRGRELDVCYGDPVGPSCPVRSRSVGLAPREGSCAFSYLFAAYERYANTPSSWRRFAPRSYHVDDCRDD